MTQVFDWRPPGKVAPIALTTSREVLHRAVQAAANVGRTLLPAPADYSHISLRWQHALGALVGEPVPAGGASLRAGLRFDPLAWLLLDERGAVLKELPLAGQDLATLETGIRAALASLGLEATRYTLKPPFKTAPHPLDSGARFSPETDSAARRELAAYYDGADRILAALGRELGIAAPPRCWPHHFDYALLHTLAGHGEEARTLGLGMSPGDHYYAEPYFYTTPWPYPKDQPLPPLGKPAFWHTFEWTGAVLRSSDLPGEAGTAVTAYWREAHSLLRPLVESA